MEKKEKKYAIVASWKPSKTQVDVFLTFFFFSFRNKYGSVQCVDWLLEETSAADEISNLASRSALIHEAIQHEQDGSLRCLLAYIRDKHLELGEKDLEKERKKWHGIKIIPYFYKWLPVYFFKSRFLMIFWAHEWRNLATHRKTFSHWARQKECYGLVMMHNVENWKEHEKTTVQTVR